MIRTAPIFSDNMVLQKGKIIKVFGTGDDGEHVRVTFGDFTAETAVKDGRWQVSLPAREDYADGLEMTVRGEGRERTFTGIASGEVWLAGGQSNMEYELRNCTTGRQHLENDRPDVRYYYTPKITLSDPAYEETMTNTCWNRFDGETAKCWSAVGYIFAKELSERLGCTVGIIGCNWGGTKASYWMSEESLSADKDMSFDLDNMRALCEGKSEREIADIYREYVDYNSAWEKRRDEYYATAEKPDWGECLKVCGECRYPGPLVPANPMSPTALYRSMIKRVCPYTLAGFLYYQGESDDNHPGPYYKLLRGLIDLWRTDWGDSGLPFLIVQLPMHKYHADPDTKSWCIIREAQDKAYRTIRNTGLAVAIDCGEYDEIHPHDKEQVAHRLFLQALYIAYGEKNEDFNAPMFDSALPENGAMTVTVRTSSPLVMRTVTSGFELAGADGTFRPAQCKVSGNKITVFSKEVPHPVSVRYLWTNYSDSIPIYNESSLPLPPFSISPKEEERG
ncbi:MAG: sialate O-acetylesterase [Ruminiclostridium sp.]|nr:sialate O-acetylesterase [Ruminiclostridium sp.]